MQAFIDAWSKRIKDTGLDEPEGLSAAPRREEGADIADALATMWIRALDYMPPVHLTFGDALSAALTADTQVRPDDSRYKLRQLPEGALRGLRHHPGRRRREARRTAGSSRPGEPALRPRALRVDAERQGRGVPLPLGNRGRARAAARRLHRGAVGPPVSRVSGIDGFVLRETVAEYYQVARLTPAELADRKITAPRDYLAHLRRIKAERDAKAAAKAKAGAMDSGARRRASDDGRDRGRRRLRDTASTAAAC